MRPPIVRRCSGAPSRGQVAPRTRATWRSPVWLPPRSVSRRIVRPRWRWSARHLVRGRGSAPGGRGRARRATGSRRPAGCRSPAIAALVEQPRLQRGPAGRQARRGAGARGRRARRRRGGLVGVELHAAEPPGVDHRAGRPPPAKPQREPHPGRLVAAARVLEPLDRARPSTSSRPVIPKRRPSVGPSVSSSSSLPMRRVPVTVRPVQRAPAALAAVVPPLRYQASGASTRRSCGRRCAPPRGGSTPPRSSRAWPARVRTADESPRS